jgi:hypothetical protein
VTIQILSATPHNHSVQEIKEWFGEPVEVIPLSSSKREPMTREYILRVTSEIHEGFMKFHEGNRVYFLVTGHPYFNMIAFELLRHLKYPFILLVYGVSGYELFGTNFVSDLLARRRMSDWTRSTPNTV